MNKRQKQVEQAKLDAEEKQLKHLKAVYKKAADDVAEKIKISNGKINVLLADFDNLDEREKSILQSQIYQRKFQASLQKQLNGFLSELNNAQYKSIDEYLKNSYETGYVGAMYDIHGQGIPVIMPINQKQVVEAIQIDSKISGTLYKKLGEDVGMLKKRIANNISRGIASAQSYSEIARNIQEQSNIGYNRAARIARTEAHRVQAKSALDAQYAAKEKGADVVKQWDSALDGRTRPTHRKLDGQLQELDDPFEVDGKKAMYPGDFGRPEEDVNCRCALMQRARWALDDDELEVLKKRAAYHGLDKTEDFEDFKKKYLKAAEKVEAEAKAVESSVRSSKIKVDEVISGHKTTPKEAKPNSVIDHVDKSGVVDARGFYGEDGFKERDLHITNHGNPKRHPYGENGEHAHDYKWDEEGRLASKTTREISEEERKDNSDIL